jgi:hypothetical protein
MCKLLLLAVAIATASATSAGSDNLPANFRVVDGCNQIPNAVHRPRSTRDESAGSIIPDKRSDCPCKSGYSYDGQAADSFTCKPILVACPAHSTNPQAATFSECTCLPGYAMTTKSVGDVDTNECHYAYLFHVHGRVWFQSTTLQFTDPSNPTSEEQALIVAFKESLAVALTIPEKNILPYNAYVTQHLDQDQYSVANAKHILSQSSAGTISSSTALAVAFAIRDESEDPKAGYTLLTKIAADQSQIEARMTTLSGGHSVTYTSTMIWALQAEFWRPQATKAIGADCTHDYECMSSHCRANDGRTSDTAAWHARTCSTKYTWTQGEQATEATPTKAPTKHPTVHLRDGIATIAFDLELGCNGVQPTGIAQNKREQLRLDMATALGLQGDQVRIDSMKSLHNFEDGNNAAPGSTGYSTDTDPFVLTYPQHNIQNGLKGTIARFSVSVHSTTTTNKQAVDDVLGQLLTTTKDSVESSIAGSTDWLSVACINLHAHSVVVQITAPPAPTPHPTPHAVGTVESLYDCSCGTVMEVNLGAKFVAATDLNQPHTYNHKPTLSLKEQQAATRTCIAAHINTKLALDSGNTLVIRDCMINMVAGSLISHAVKVVAPATAYQNTDTGTTITGSSIRNAAWSTEVYDYDYKFTIAVKGQNMHEGNKVYDAINGVNAKELAIAVNQCTQYMSMTTRETAEADGTTYSAHNQHFNGELWAHQHHTGDHMSVEGPERRWVPEINTAPFYAMEPSSMQLAYREGHCDSIETPPAATPVANVDCIYSEWSAQTSCSKSCGAGKTSRYRTVISGEVGNGTPCNMATLVEETDCNEAVCIVKCAYTAWDVTNWADVTCKTGAGSDAPDATCDAQVNDNKKTRTRSMTAAWTAAPVSHREAGCAGPLTQSITCYTGSSCPVDCVRDDTSENTGQCSAACSADGSDALPFLIKTKRILTPSMNGGNVCEPQCSSCSDGDADCLSRCLQKREDCNLQACPVDCAQGAWSRWGSCSQNCVGKASGTRLAGATQLRTRIITTEQKGAGAPCGAPDQTRLCALHPCGAKVCTVSAQQLSENKYPLTCTYEDNIVYTHHVNDVHQNQLFMCYHNIVTGVCTCLCWDKANIAGATTTDKISFLHNSQASRAAGVKNFHFGGRGMVKTAATDTSTSFTRGEWATAINNGDATASTYQAAAGNGDVVQRPDTTGTKTHTFYNTDGSSVQMPNPYNEQEFCTGTNCN